MTGTPGRERLEQAQDLAIRAGNLLGDAANLLAGWQDETWRALEARSHCEELADVIGERLPDPRAGIRARARGARFARS